MLIENHGFQFILCGSSARKLKRGKANFLGGRAWRFEMFPRVSAELTELDLLRILNRGLIPIHYLQDQYRKSLKAYTQDYLKEEVFDEGLTRNIPAFSRFFDAVGYSHGELTNYANIARDCGVDAKTVKEYYQILVDTPLVILDKIHTFDDWKNYLKEVCDGYAEDYRFQVTGSGRLDLYQRSGESLAGRHPAPRPGSPRCGERNFQK